MSSFAQKLVVLVSGALLLARPVWSAETAEKAVAGDSLVIRVTAEKDEGMLGFGWSREERLNGRHARWIKELEADVWFELEEVGDMDIRLTAAPRYLGYRRQNIGVYVNDKFITEWVCPDSPEYADFEGVIPGEALKQGRNRLTFRMGYRRRHGSDRRELALAVEQITLTPR